MVTVYLDSLQRNNKKKAIYGALLIDTCCCKQEASKEVKAIAASVAQEKRDFKKKSIKYNHNL